MDDYFEANNLFPILLYSYEDVILQLFLFCKTLKNLYLSSLSAILVNSQINVLRKKNYF
jgi:hypothetical protein